MRTCTHKSCNNPVFGTDKKTKLGYCKYHQAYRTDIVRTIKKNNSVAKKTSREIRSTGNFVSKIEYDLKLDRFHEQEAWYDRVAKIIDKNPYCWNCGKFILKNFYRAASAHILPKRKTYGCPSVATHDMNFIVLGAACGCHGKYDTSWDDAMSMKVWPIAEERFKIFAKEIAKSEYKNLPPLFREIVENADCKSV